MAFPTSPLIVLIELFIGGAWVDVTSDVYLRDPIKIERGRKDEGSKIDASKCGLQFNNGESNINPAVIGRYSPRNPESDLFGLIGRNTPVRVTLTTPTGTVSRRFTGEIPAWPSRWDVSGNDVWVPVQAAGPLWRLAQGKSGSLSAMQRLITAAGPVAYWALTDGEDAKQGLPAAGTNPMRSTGLSGSLFQGQPNWGKGTLATWMEPVVEMPEATNGRIAAVPPLADVSGGYSVDHCRAGIGGTADAIQIGDAGTRLAADPYQEWEVSAETTAKRLDVTLWTDPGSGMSGFVALNATVPAVFDGGPHHVRLTITPAGADTGVALYVDGALAGSTTVVGVAAYRPPAKITYFWFHGPADTPALSVGHIAYWTAATAPNPIDAYRAAVGWDGELAGRRVERLCAEEDVALAVTGDLDDTQVLGPQRAEPVLTLLDQAGEVDGGLLTDDREALGLRYRTGRSKYNQGV